MVILIDGEKVSTFRETTATSSEGKQPSEMERLKRQLRSTMNELQSQDKIPFPGPNQFKRMELERNMAAIREKLVRLTGNRLWDDTKYCLFTAWVYGPCE